MKALEIKKVGHMKKVSQTIAALFSKQLIFGNILKLRLFKSTHIYIYFPIFLLQSLRSLPS